MRHLSAVIALAITIQAAAAPGHSAHADPGFEALRLVFRNQSMPIGEIESCRGLVDGAASPTLGDWMAWVLSQLEPKDGTSGIEASCRGEPERQQCEVYARRASGEEVWRWGVSFGANRTTGVIGATSLLCHMAG